MMTRNTTPDLIRLSRRLSDFFSHQFQSGKKVLESIGPTYYHGHQQHHRRHHRPYRSGAVSSDENFMMPSSSKNARSDASSGTTSGLFGHRHHRHWQRPLAAVLDSDGLSGLSFCLPKRGTLLGGTLKLQGKDLALACFSGINFRSNKWAVFHLSDPTISFTTEAQFVRPVADPNSGGIPDISVMMWGAGGGGGGLFPGTSGQSQQLPSQAQQMDTSVVQEFSIKVGKFLTDKQCATIFRFSREKQNAPTHTATLREWFHYAFASLPEMDNDVFPHRARERSESVSSLDNSNKRHKSHKMEFKHNAVDIFALPCMECKLTTNHLQKPLLPPASVDDLLRPTESADEPPPKAVVECSFYSSFENHIQVRMDAELFFFLHELVINYMHECEKMTGGSGGGGNKPMQAGDSTADKKDKKKDKQEKKKDKQGKADKKSEGKKEEGDTGGGKKDAVENGGKEENGASAESSAKRDGDQPAPSASSSSSSNANASEDWREFVCKTWHLKPTMSFLTAGVFSEPIEPSVGVDYVLDKLGFKHANTTIPKWTQRGVMDPMDKFLAVMMRKFIQSLGEKEG